MMTIGVKRLVGAGLRETMIPAAAITAVLAAPVLAAPAGSAEKAPVTMAQAGTAPGKAAPAGSTEPEVTTATYQDWLVRCVTPPSAARICEATQTIQVQGQSAPVAVIAIGRLAADGPLRVVVQLPAGLWLPAGAKLQTGEKAVPVAMEFKRCLQACFAELDVDKALEQSLRAASGNGSIQFEDGARRPVSLPFSFRGFIAALDAALKPR
ncbi:invasion associated locus B family protein [Methylobacterium sp. ID0610]|uniref:invasion associated locus B family protein n=1 Tax=Methylobacterium carpenticola TaxID=3344827 RepID=UPI003690BEEA